MHCLREQMINLVHPSVLTALQSYTLCMGGNAMHMARTYDMHLQHAQVYHNGQDVKKYQGVKRDLMKMMHLQDIMFS